MKYIVKNYSDQILFARLCSFFLQFGYMDFGNVPIVW